MKKGFTLVELLAVILLLGIIALITMPKISTSITNSKINSAKASISSYIKGLEDMYVNSFITNPYSKGVFEEGVEYTKEQIEAAGFKVDGKVDKVFVTFTKNGKILFGKFCENGFSYEYSEGLLERVTANDYCSM